MGAHLRKKLLIFEFDGTIGIYFLVVVPFLTFWPFQANVDGELHTHANTKVIRYPAIQKSVRVYQDGIFHTTENVAFDESTGKPIAVKSYDEHAGAYLSLQVPGHWEYPNLGQKAMNEKKTFTDLDMTSENYGNVTYLNLGDNSCDMLSVMSEGDLLQLGEKQLYHVLRLEPAFDRVALAQSSLSEETLPDGPVSKFTILRSGLRNELVAQVGSFPVG